MRSELLTILVRPGMGKTTMMIDVINNFIKDDKRVLFISLECSKKSIIDRFESTSNLTIMDEPIRDVNEIEKLIDKYKPDCLAIDYLNLFPINIEESMLLLKNLKTKYNIRIIGNVCLGRDCIGLTRDEIMEKLKHNPIVELADRCMCF